MSPLQVVDNRLDWIEKPVAILEDKGRWYQFSTDQEMGPVVSVTTVIDHIFGKPFPDIARTDAEYAARRGQEVHRAIAMLCGSIPEQTLDWDSLDPEVAPRVRAFDEWRHLVGWEPIYIERAFLSKRYGFAGTPDQVGYQRKDPTLTVVDWKPRAAPLSAMQLSAYAIAVRECLGMDGSVIRRITLHLDGVRARPVWHSFVARDRDVFLAALSCFYYGCERKLWR